MIRSAFNEDKCLCVHKIYFQIIDFFFNPKSTFSYIFLWNALFYSFRKFFIFSIFVACVCIGPLTQVTRYTVDFAQLCRMCFFYASFINFYYCCSIFIFVDSLFTLIRLLEVAGVFFLPFLFVAIMSFE